jgi:hypothetical protein
MADHTLLEKATIEVAPIHAHQLGTMGRGGLRVAYSLEPVRGFTGRTLNFFSHRQILQLI